jgi:hypothetical protein
VASAIVRAGPVAVLALLIAVAGCGDSAPAMGPVHGTVYYRGTPVPGGIIVFAPDVERGNTGPTTWGEIRTDGTYSLRTDNPEGITAGWHRITITAADPPGQPATLPRRYADPELSGLTREVEPGRPNVLDFYLD